MSYSVPEVRTNPQTIRLDDAIVNRSTVGKEAMQMDPRLRWEKSEEAFRRKIENDPLCTNDGCGKPWSRHYGLESKPGHRYCYDYGDLSPEFSTRTEMLVVDSKLEAFTCPKCHSATAVRCTVPGTWTKGDGWYCLNPLCTLSDNYPDTAEGMVEEIAKLRKEKLEAALREPRWIVNDMGELGVEVSGRCWFMYKGRSLEYEDGQHDSGKPILYRHVGKREFGETVWPWKWHLAGRSEDSYNEECVYHAGLSDGPPNNPDYDWKPLPTFKGAAE